MKEMKRKQLASGVFDMEQRLPFGIKLDLEGHTGARLRELCQQKGIDLLPAPAEHHESIAQVQRTIGHLCRKTEAFLRGSREHPRRAAHNTLPRVHGFSPLQWALGRDCIF